MDKPVSVVLVGLGGYGEVYLSAILDEPRGEACRIVAAVDPEPLRCSRLAELESRGVPIHPSMEPLAHLPPAELVVISSPIHHHCEQTCLALSWGSNVLCEKPAAATVQEVDRMIETAELTGRWVAIGYQWSFSRVIQELKGDIRSGVFGRPLRLRSLCLWPRDESYYGRNDWAGRIRDDQGRWVLDSPLNNAMAHDLHNMLYVLGDQFDTAAEPAEVVAETYRANDIENFDTAAVRVRTTAGVEILFFGSHAVAENADPVFRYEFSGATVEYAGHPTAIVARLADGSCREYPSPNSESQCTKLFDCLAAVRRRGPIACGLRTARPHLVCVNGVQDSLPEPRPFPATMVERRLVDPAPPATPAKQEGASHPLTCAEGLPNVLRACYERGVLPSESGVPWARPGRTVDLRGYACFPGGRKQ